MSEVDGLARDLDRAATEVRRDVRAVAAKGALNVKTAWRRRWTGLANAPRLAGTVTYDTKLQPYGASAEIGPDVSLEKRQGYLGNLIEYGSVNNAPHPGGAPSAQEEEPRLAKAMEDLGEKAVGW